MTDATHAAESPAVARGSALDYDAFLSYTHVDEPVAKGIQKGLHHIGKRLGQLRALRVFRDDTDLPPNPDLWEKITDAMARANYLIVVLSPHAASAKAPWVDRELRHWLETRGREKLLLVLADGQLHWDEHTGRFDPQLSTAAPPVLTEPGSQPLEPLYIDVSADKPWDYRAPVFRQKVTKLAAPIHDKSIDQMGSDDLREQRRFRRWRGAAIAGLIVLTVTAVIAAFIAVRSEQEAIRQRDTAIALRLVPEATEMLVQRRPGGDVQALQELLAATALSRDDAVVKGGLLDALTQRQSTFKVTDTDDQVDTVAFSLDGHRLASSRTLGDTVRLWDADTGELIGAPLKTDSGLAGALALSPDGRRLAAGDENGHLLLWNTEREAVPAPLILPAAHTRTAVWAVAFSRDGQRVAAASDDGTVGFWNAHSGQQLGQTTVAGIDGGLHAAFSPDLDRVAARDPANDNAVRLWNAVSGVSLGPSLGGNPGGGIEQVVFSPDGHRLAAKGFEGPVQLWDIDSRRPISTLNTGRTSVWCVGFSPNGRRIATGGEDGTVQLWDADTGKAVGEPLTGHNGPVHSVVFSPDDHHLATGSWDGTVRLWYRDVGQPLTGHTGAVTSGAFSPDGRRVATGSGGDDNSVRLWDADTGQQVSAPLIGHPPSTVAGVVFSPKGERLISVGYPNTESVWNPDTGRLISSGELGPSKQVVYSAISPDGHLIAIGSAWFEVTVWDADSRKPIAAWHTRAPSDIQALKDQNPGTDGEFLVRMAFSADGHRLATYSEFDHSVRFWNPEKGVPSGAPLSLGTGPNLVNGLAFSPDGHRFAVVDGETVQLWNLDTGKPVGKRLIGQDVQRPIASAANISQMVNSVAFSPEGDRVATGNGDATVRLFNAGTGEPIGHPFHGHHRGVNSVSFSPDGGRLVSGSDDATARIWPAVANAKALCDKLTANMSHKQWHDWVSPDVDYPSPPICSLPVPPD